MTEQADPIPELECRLKLPADALPVLTGLARVAGWRLGVEHDPGDQKQAIQFSSLGEISLAMWNDRSLGEVAANIVQSRKKHSAGEVYVDNHRGSVVLQHNSGLGKYLKPDSLDPDVCLATVARFCAQLPLVYGFEIEPKQPPFYDGYSTKLANICATEPTAERLQRYLSETGLADHKLHGTLGMAIEVLKQVAGMAPAHNLASIPYSNEIVSGRALRKIFKPPLVKPHHRQTLLSQIGILGGRQLKNGQPSNLGEIIFTGNLTLGRRDQIEQWQGLALDSLRQLGELFQEGSPAKSLLQGPLLQEALREAQE